MHAVKLKGITCVVVDVAVSEKNEAKGEAVFTMGCGATRTHHPVSANRLTDGPINCMACMAKNADPWNPARWIEKIASSYIDCKIRGQTPTISVSVFGGDSWRKRHGISRALKFMGYLGRRTDTTTYIIPDETLSLLEEAKPDLVEIGRSTKVIRESTPGVSWNKLDAAQKKYVFTHAELYTFYVGSTYGSKAATIDGNIRAIGDRFQNYGDGFRFADAEYIEAYRQEHYEQNLRKLRKEKFAEWVEGQEFVPLPAVPNPVKLDDDLARTVRTQVFESLKLAQEKASLWTRRVEFIQALDRGVESKGGWDTFERQYLEELDKLIRCPQ